MRPSLSLLLAALALLLGSSRAEKLSVLLPGQEGEFSIGHGEPGFDLRSAGLGLGLPTAAAPASLPTFPPASNGVSGGGSIFNSGVSLEGSVPALSGGYNCNCIIVLFPPPLFCDNDFFLFILWWLNLIIS